MSEVEQIQQQIDTVKHEIKLKHEQAAYLETQLKEARKRAELKNLQANATMSRHHEVQFGGLGLWTRELSQGERVHVKTGWAGTQVVRLSDGKEYSLDTDYFRLDGQVDPNPDDVHGQTYLNGKTDCGLQAYKGKVKTSQNWKEVTCQRCLAKH